MFADDGCSLWRAGYGFGIADSRQALGDERPGFGHFGISFTVKLSPAFE